MTLSYFYVLYDKVTNAFSQDSQIGFTTDVLSADQYSSFEEADKNRMFYSPEVQQRLSIKKISLIMDEA